MERQLEVTTYFGKKLTVGYSADESLQELKAKILSLLSDQPEIKDLELIYRGRLVRNQTHTLGELIDPTCATIYVNAKGVHGGCSKIACG